VNMHGSLVNDMLEFLSCLYGSELIRQLETERMVFLSCLYGSELH
jgi:hypothetical protein